MLLKSCKLTLKKQCKQQTSQAVQLHGTPFTKSHLPCFFRLSIFPSNVQTMNPELPGPYVKARRSRNISPARNTPPALPLPRRTRAVILVHPRCILIAGDMDVEELARLGRVDSKHNVQRGLGALLRSQVGRRGAEVCFHPLFKASLSICTAKNNEESYGAMRNLHQGRGR